MQATLDFANKPKALATFKDWMERGEGAELAGALFVAMAFAQHERERVDKYIAPIFAKYGFRATLDLPNHPGSRELLTDRSHLYLCADEEAVTRYFAECDEAHKAYGFAQREPGQCPALTAEYEQIKAEWALMKSAGALMGFDWEAANGNPKMRKRLLDLLLGDAAIKLRDAKARKAVLDRNLPR